MVKHYLYRALTFLNKYSLFGLLTLLRLKISGRTVLLSGSCLRCGTCCKKINLEASGNWVRSEEVFLKISKDYPEYSRLKISGRDSQGFLVFSCTWCTPEGICRDYENRLTICRNFPDVSLVFCGGGLPSGCGYRFQEGIPFDKVLAQELRKK